MTIATYYRAEAYTGILLRIKAVRSYSTQLRLLEI